MDAPLISDELAVAQTIILSSGNGLRFSKRLMNRLKLIMLEMKQERLEAGDCEAIFIPDKNVIIIRKCGKIVWIRN